jgi:hypothetical protein
MNGEYNRQKMIETIEPQTATTGYTPYNNSRGGGGTGSGNNRRPISADIGQEL